MTVDQQQQSSTRDSSSILKISWSDVHEQTTVGVGSFCKVQQVHIMNHDYGLQDKRLALKSLKTSMVDHKDDADFASAATDLFIEGELLSKLDHPNIVKLHGVCDSGPIQAFQETQKGYFLVMDLLDDTLMNRMKKFRIKINRKVRGSGGLYFRSTRVTMSPNEMIERVEGIAIGIAHGINHLHQNNIVWRDLKPDNIGFDLEGIPKIFDLGFAREIQNVPKNEVAGTLRYLAPEVVTTGIYGMASDVYSFSLLLWELCTLEKPYEKLTTPKSFTDSVILGNYRPSLSKIRHVALRNLIQSCWNADPTLRPSMDEVIQILQQQCSSSSSRPPSSSTSFSSKRKTKQSDKRGGRRNSSMIVERDLFSQSFSGPFELENPEASFETLSLTSTTLLLREEQKHVAVGKKGGKRMTLSPFRNRRNRKNDLSASDRQRIQVQ